MPRVQSRNFIASGAIVLKSNGLTIGGSTLSSGTASTTIQTNLASATIGLGASNCGGTCGLSLTSTELGKIVAGDLIVGDNTNGNITVEGIASTDTDQFTSVTLNATSSRSSVIFENSDSTFQAITVNTGNGITLSSNLTTNGTTSFNSDSDANGSGDFTLAASQSLNTTDNSLSITANDMALGAGSSITSGTAETTVLAGQTGRTIGLGSGAGSFSLDNSELSQITASNLTIGDGTNGTITVGGLTTATTPLTLNATSTGSAVNFATAASSGLGNLTINAGTGGVDFGVDVATTGSLTINSDAAIAGTGVLTVTGTASLNITGTGNATVVSNSDLTLGNSTIGGDLTVTVNGAKSLNVSGNVTTSGNIIAKAESSGGAITMETGGSFNAGTGTINLSADQDITLGLLTTSNSSTTSITLTSTNGGVRDAGTSDLDISTSGRLVADLVTGFGTSDNAIETNLVSVDIDNSTSGDINIFETDTLNIFKIAHAGTGDIKVSFIGEVTNKLNATAFAGAVLFIRRDNENLPVGDKTLGRRADETTGQLFPKFEFPEPIYLDLDPARFNRNKLPSLELFSEAKSLVEIDDQTAIYFDGLENLENVLEGTGIENTQIADRKRSSRRVLTRRSKTTFEKEQVAEISFRKLPKNSSNYFEEISGRGKASYQSSPKNSRPPKPLFSLSKADFFSFLP